MLPKDILEITNYLSGICYENLTKIICLHDKGFANQAARMPEDFENDADSLLGGGTCFSITWYLYHRLREKGYNPKLIMGHKRIQPNAHCALLLEFEENQYFFDPGYLIFDPLKIPAPNAILDFPLNPNQVRLKRLINQLGVDLLGLFTGRAPDYKLRFEFNLKGVGEDVFRKHWQESFSWEMMNYPVLNKLDREKGIQYYFQKSNLMIRSSKGSEIINLNGEDMVQKLSDVFQIAPETIEKAINILGKK